MTVTAASRGRPYVGDWALLSRITNQWNTAVWRGQHSTKPGLRAAVKVIEDRSLAAEFWGMEAKVLAAVQGHPNVVKLLDAVAESGCHATVTELGRCTVADHLASVLATPLDLRWRWASELLSALAHVHAKGVLHNDVKLENCVLIDPPEYGPDDDEYYRTDAAPEPMRLTLVDFGLSTFAAATDAEERVDTCGTLAYMAPEILERKTHGRPADIWAFGVCLFKLLFKRHPFRSGTVGQLLADIAAGSHRETLRSCAPGISALFDRLLANDPADRPTADNLLKTVWFAGAVPVEAARAVAIDQAAQAAAVAAATDSGLESSGSAEFSDCNVELDEAPAATVPAVRSKAYAAEIARMDAQLAAARARYTRNPNRTYSDSLEAVRKLALTTFHERKNSCPTLAAVLPAVPDARPACRRAISAGHLGLASAREPASGPVTSSPTPPASPKPGRTRPSPPRRRKTRPPQAGPQALADRAQARRKRHN